MGAGDHELSAYFASTNDIERANTPLVTFSHYAPRYECVPEKRFLLEPCLAKVSGSDHLGELVLRLKPDVHVFGHTHIPIDIDLEGTYYVQWPLGSPREQSRQCARANALGPLELYSTATGVRRRRGGLRVHDAASNAHRCQWSICESRALARLVPRLARPGTVRSPRRRRLPGLCAALGRLPQVPVAATTFRKGWK